MSLHALNQTVSTPASDGAPGNQSASTEVDAVPFSSVLNEQRAKPAQEVTTLKPLAHGTKHTDSNRALNVEAVAVTDETEDVALREPDSRSHSSWADLVHTLTRDSRAVVRRHGDAVKPDEVGEEDVSAEVA